MECRTVRYGPPRHGVDDFKAGPRYGGGRGVGGWAGQGGVKMEMEAEGPTGLRGWRRETACISAMMRCGCHQM